MREGYVDNGVLKTILGSFAERLPFDISFEAGSYHLTLGLVKPHDPFFDMMADILDASTGIN
jgi:hypothetical protein